MINFLWISINESGGWWEKFDSSYGYGCVTKPQGKLITIPWTSSWLSRLSMLKINITAWLDLINSHLYYEMYNVILPYLGTNFTTIFSCVHLLFAYTASTAWTSVTHPNHILIFLYQFNSSKSHRFNIRLKFLVHRKMTGFSQESLYILYPRCKSFNLFNELTTFLNNVIDLAWILRPFLLNLLLL